MKLTRTITFVSLKLYRLITIICLIILISHIVQLALIREFIVSVQVGIFPLNMCDTIIYVALWWEKYLSKRSLIKHTCSWRDKLILLWTLNRQAKIFLRISHYCTLAKFTKQLQEIWCYRQLLGNYGLSNIATRNKKHSAFHEGSFVVSYTALYETSKKIFSLSQNHSKS